MMSFQPVQTTRDGALSFPTVPGFTRFDPAPALDVSHRKDIV